MTRLVPFSVAVAIGLFGWLLAPSSATAATYSVAMTPFLTFVPGSLQIQVGDTVVWTNEDDVNQHDTTSLDGFWASPSLDHGQTYVLTFPISGNFPYEDSFYGASGMTGTIVVKANLAPPLLIVPLLLPSPDFQFTVTNLSIGQTNIIQASTNLLTWSGIYTNVAADSSYTYTDHTTASASQKFYRVLALP